MSKILAVVFMVSILFVLFAVPALAQDGVQLPDTAVEGLAALVALLTVWIGGGAIGSWLTDMLKRLPFLTDGDVSKISGAGAQFVAAVLSVGLGVIVQFVTPWAEYLDAFGIWPIIVAVVAALPAYFFSQLTYKLTK